QGLFSFFWNLLVNLMTLVNLTGFSCDMEYQGAEVLCLQKRQRNLKVSGAGCWKRARRPGFCPERLAFFGME
ncbi:hypothetical protein, partial [uncultured Oscillibacter sp.]|uniref:hypothetical protein n=1 Tax=uncultured Oscillibacter sp. TaxID=876091 RepID=UPI0025DCD83F